MFVDWKGISKATRHFLGKENGRKKEPAEKEQKCGSWFQNAQRGKTSFSCQEGVGVNGCLSWLQLLACHVITSARVLDSGVAICLYSSQLLTYNNSLCILEKTESNCYLQPLFQPVVKRSQDHAVGWFKSLFDIVCGKGLYPVAIFYSFGFSVLSNALWLMLKQSK